MSNVEMLPQYSTVSFTDIWCSAEDFKADFADSPFAGCIQDGSVKEQKDNVSLVFYLLYAKYGNNPIANRDEQQFKYKIFSIIFQYGPTWEKRLYIQDQLRKIKDEDLIIGSKAIYNAALNPSTAPSTGSLDELTYINSQNTTNYKKSKMDAYAQLWELLRTDVTGEFINKFKVCFKQFVAPEQPLIYVTEYDYEDNGNE